MFVRVRHARRPSALDVGVHCINHTHLSMEKRWEMVVMEVRVHKRSHTEGKSTVGEESQEKEHLVADRRRYLQ